MSGPIPISAAQIGGAAALILINGLLSWWLQLDLHRKLFIAGLRTIVQLTLLGYILLPVFKADSVWLVLALCTAMIAVAAREALQRSSRTFAGAYRAAFFALLVSAGVTTWLGTAVLIGVEPWWAPRYLVPLLGMVLGNGLNGITLGVDHALRGLDDGRDLVETRLALGASWWEASRPVASSAVRLAMVPIINVMSVVGVVSIPGMMTGQLLGGTNPEQAARYQIVILFMIAAATALGSIVSVLWATRKAFDDHHTLREDWIRRRP